MRWLVLLLVFCSCLHRQGVDVSSPCVEVIESWGVVSVRFVDCEYGGVIYLSGGSFDRAAYLRLVGLDCVTGVEACGGWGEKDYGRWCVIRWDVSRVGLTDTLKNLVKEYEKAH